VNKFDVIDMKMINDYKKKNPIVGPT